MRQNKINRMWRKPKAKRYFHIMWFGDIDKIDKGDPKALRMWMQMVLTRGNERDIRELKFSEIKKMLPDLFLPEEVRNLWTDYFKNEGNINKVSKGYY